MKRPRLLTTSAVRLALRYALLYALVLGLALLTLLWSTHRYIDSTVTESLQQEFSALTQLYVDGGSRPLVDTLTRRSAEGAQRGDVYLLVSPEGKRLAGNLHGWPEGADFELDGKVHTAWIDEAYIPVNLYDDDAYWPVIAARLPDNSRLLLARNVGQDQQLQEVAEYLIYVMSTVIVLILIMGLMLGRAIYRRVDTISRTASEIMAGDLSRRIPVSRRNDEFDALAARLNTMLERIQQLIKGIRDVTDNVAHDLRNPLSRLRNRLEVTLLEPRTEQEYRDAIAQSIEDAESLIRTFNAMLEVAQLEAGGHRVKRDAVDLKELAHDLVDLYQPIARKKGQRLELLADGAAVISGSRDLLAQAIGNLLDNAIKYAPDGSVIHLEVRTLPDRVELRVHDAGPGIPAGERERVLERFVRLESSRHTDGNGLGLSLVKAVCRFHHAELLLEDAGPGLRVTLQFRQGANS